MGLEQLSFGDLYLGWTIGFMLIFSVIAVARAENNLRSVIEHLVAAGGLAVVLAAWFALPMWLAIRLAT